MGLRGLCRETLTASWAKDKIWSTVNFTKPHISTNGQKFEISMIKVIQTFIQQGHIKIIKSEE